MEEQTTERNQYVLILDDDTSQRFLLTEILSHEGFATLACETADEAFELVRTHEVAVAIADQRLSGLSGTQALERIGAIDERTRVIIHTGYGSFASAKDSVNLGAFAYVEKAGDPGELVRHVSRGVQSWMRLALHKSEERYRLLAEMAPVGIFHTDADGLLLYVNDKWCEIAGLSRKEALQDGWAPGLHPADRDKMIAEFYECVAQQIAFSALYRFQRGNKTTWVYGQARPTKSDEGTVTGYVGTMTDITERKLAEESLRLLDTALQQANLPVSISTSDLEKPPQIVYVNAAFTTLTGYPAQELIGRPPHILYGPKTEFSVLDRQRALLREGQSFDGEMVHYHKDGRELVIELRIDPVRDDSDRVSHWVTTYRDVAHSQPL